MTLKYKIPLITALFIIVINVLFSYLLFTFSFQPVIEKVREDRMSKLAIQLESLLEDYQMRVASLADMLAERNALKVLVTKADRNALLELLQPVYALQHDNYNISTISIIQAPAKNLLRLHNLDQFGDDVSSRNMVIAVNSQQKSVHGIEIGLSGIDIRAMSPLIHEGKPIGMVEVGIGFEGIIDTIKANTGFEVAFFVNQTLLAETAKDLAAPESEDIVGGMRVLYKTNWKKIRSVISADMLRNVPNTVILSRKIKGKSLGIVLTPVQDFSGETIGVFVAVREFENILILEENFSLELIVLTALQIIFLVGMVWIVFFGWMLRPLQDLTLCFKELIKNDRTLSDSEVNSLSIRELSCRQDEVGELACQLKRLLENRLAKEKAETGSGGML